MKLMPKITAAVTAASSDRAWVFFCVMGVSSFRKSILNGAHYTTAARKKQGGPPSYGENGRPVEGGRVGGRGRIAVVREVTIG